MPCYLAEASQKVINYLFKLIKAIIIVICMLKGWGCPSPRSLAQRKKACRIGRGKTSHYLDLSSRPRKQDKLLSYCWSHATTTLLGSTTNLSPDNWKNCMHIPTNCPCKTSTLFFQSSNFLKLYRSIYLPPPMIICLWHFHLLCIKHKSVIEVLAGKDVSSIP